MSEHTLTIRIIISFALAVGTVYATARIIGEENKAKWFKKSKRRGFFNRRGFLGETCHFGVPCTLTGVGVMFAMLGVIFIFGYSLVFVI